MIYRNAQLEEEEFFADPNVPMIPLKLLKEELALMPWQSLQLPPEIIKAFRQVLKLDDNGKSYSLISIA
jgi:hypothetical protein